MSTRRRLATALIPLALLGAACGDSGTSTDSASSNNTGESTDTSEQPEAEEPEGKGGEIIKTGFGQRDEFVWVTSLVKNLTDKAGATVTVQYNVKDAAGKILVSDSQVEAFSRGGQTLAVGTQLEVPGGSTAATVDASLVVEADGIGEESPAVQIGPITVGEDEFGSPSASFEVTNPTSEPLQSLRLGVVCYDAAGKIIGGTSEFPDVPPNGTARVDTLSLIVSGNPAKCEAYDGGVL